MISKFRTLLVFVLSAFCAVSSLGQANTLQDLVGGRASSGEGELESRGYVLTHSDKSDDSSYTYWWSSRAKKCVVVRTTDGRYASIVDTLPGDCNQTEKRKDNNNAAVGAAVGIGAAAAIIGAIAMSHKSHHHDDDKHHDDPNKEAEYERGYRDGLYNSSYHNYSNTENYRKGYEAGVKQRRQETSHSSGYGGYAPYVNLNDLVGARASTGEDEMRSRGFRNVDGFKSGNTSYTIWWNGRTRQCIQVATADGRYDSVTDIQTHPKCR